MDWIRLRTRLQPLGRPLSWVWLAAITGYVTWKLSTFGWSRIAAELPTQPAFYLVYLASFLVLPWTERVVYGIIWGMRLPLVPFLRKRALNNVVLGYSGDLYFYLWSRAQLKIPDRRLLAGIKDSSILSGIAGTSVTVLLVLLFVGLGRGELVGRVWQGQTVWAVLLGVAGVLVVPLAFRFRRALFWIDERRAARVFAIHLARVLAVLALQVLQWWVAIPAAPLMTWLLFVTAQSLVNQVPLAPNRDLLFLAVSLELLGGTGVDRAALAALMVATALLKQLTNLVTLLLTNWSRAPALDRPEAAEEGAGTVKESA